MAGNSSGRLILQPLISPYFLAAVFLCFLVEILERANIRTPYLHFWLNDLLGLPVILNLTVFMKRLLSAKKQFTLSLLQVFIIFLYVSLVFEFALPKYSSKYTSDPADVICYAAGAAFYWLKMRAPLASARQL